jgi:phage gp46-like protein
MGFTGDILFRATADGGEISYVEGQPEMTTDLSNLVYLALFGGNAEDDGTAATEKFQWWGNFIEAVPSRRLRSRTQNVLRGAAITPGDLPRFEDAILQDLQFIKLDKIASSINAEISITAPKRLEIEITIDAEGSQQNFTLVPNWLSFGDK